MMRCWRLLTVGALVVACASEVGSTPSGLSATGGQDGGNDGASGSVNGPPEQKVKGAWEAEICENSSIATDDVDVYITCEHEIERVSIQGGPVSRVMKVDGGPSRSPVVVGDELYWLRDLTDPQAHTTDIVHAPKAGGEIQVLASDSGIGRLFVDDAAVYWVAGNAGGAASALKAVARAGGAPTTIAHWEGTPTAVRDGDRFLYQDTTGDEDALRSVPVGLVATAPTKVLDLPDLGYFENLSGDTLIMSPGGGFYDVLSVADHSRTELWFEGGPACPLAFDGSMFAICDRSVEGKRFLVWGSKPTEERIVGIDNHRGEIQQLLARPYAMFSIGMILRAGEPGYFLRAEPRCDGAGDPASCKTIPVVPDAGIPPVPGPLFNQPSTPDATWCGAATTCTGGTRRCCNGNCFDINGGPCSSDMGLDCDGPEDCPGSQCRLSAIPNIVRSMCTTNVAAGDLVCRSAADCPGATPNCCRLAGEYNYLTYQIGVCTAQACGPE